jgi:hypothetical protein
VKDIQVRESLAGLEKAAEYQVAIAEIARVTALDFGALVAADELGKAPRRRLNESLIGSLFPMPEADHATNEAAVPIVPVAAAGSGPYPVVQVSRGEDPILGRGDAATFFAGMHEIARGLSKLAPLVERIADRRD